MNGRRAKQIRKYLRHHAFDVMKRGDVRTEVNFGRFTRDADGKEMFVPPQTLTYPSDHIRRSYQNLKDLFKRN